MKKLQEADVDGRGGLKLSSVVAEYTGPLERFFRRRVADPAEVDDLVQEVFLRLARQSNVAAIENPHAYVFQTAANILRDSGRWSLSRRRAEHEPFEEAIHGCEAISPERIASARQSVAALKAALAELPERTQTVFVLHRFEGLRYGEIAVTLGISVSAVEKHMMRAMSHIVRGMEWP